MSQPTDPFAAGDSVDLSWLDTDATPPTATPPPTPGAAPIPGRPLPARPQPRMPVRPQPAPAPVQQPAPAPAPAPTPAPAVQQPAPAPAPAPAQQPAPAPAPTPAPAVQQPAPAPAPVQQPAPAPAPVQHPAPVQQPAPAPAPTPAPAPAQQPAPVVDTYDPAPPVAVDHGFLPAPQPDVTLTPSPEPLLTEPTPPQPDTWQQAAAAAFTTPTVSTYPDPTPEADPEPTPPPRGSFAGFFKKKQPTAAADPIMKPPKGGRLPQRVFRGLVYFVLILALATGFKNMLAPKQPPTTDEILAAAATEFGFNDYPIEEANTLALKFATTYFTVNRSSVSARQQQLAALAPNVNNLAWLAQGRTSQSIAKGPYVVARKTLGSNQVLVTVAAQVTSTRTPTPTWMYLAIPLLGLPDGTVSISGAPSFTGAPVVTLPEFTQTIEQAEADPDDPATPAIQTVLEGYLPVWAASDLSATDRFVARNATSAAVLGLGGVVRKPVITTLVASQPFTPLDYTPPEVVDPTEASPDSTTEGSDPSVATAPEATLDTGDIAYDDAREIHLTLTWTTASNETWTQDYRIIMVNRDSSWWVYDVTPGGPTVTYQPPEPAATTPTPTPTSGS